MHVTAVPAASLRARDIHPRRENYVKAVDVKHCNGQHKVDEGTSRGGRRCYSRQTQYRRHEAGGEN